MVGKVGIEKLAYLRCPLSNRLGIDTPLAQLHDGGWLGGDIKTSRGQGVLENSIPACNIRRWIKSVIIAQFLGSPRRCPAPVQRRRIQVYYLYPDQTIQPRAA